jgi:RHS repeat-associated protein
MTYDAQSRPLSRTEPDLTTNWTWGNSASSYNVGKLASVTAASILGTYQESYTYDSLSRPTSTVITIPGDQSYTYTKSYNAATGRLGTLAYPVSSSGYQLALNYTFTNGLLSALSDASTGTVYWAANGSNARGQITEETLGNEVVTSRNFDAVTGLLESIGAGVGAGSTTLQNASYLYDEMGNLSQQQDNNRGLTENFFYDNDYRLSYSTLDGTQNLNLTYAANGNIASRSDIGEGTSWTYDPVHLHAATQTGTGGYSFVYDANGNATSRNGYTNTWTSYNYPSGVTSAGESASFYYGPNRRRIETVYSGGIGTETTYHVGRLLEKVANANGTGVTDWRYYIKAGNELVGIYSTQAAAMHYTIGDSQGGIATLTSGGESCPAGYTLSGSTCSGTVTQSATVNYSCPAGYTLSGSSCIDAASTAATATYSCPAGYSLSGTTCSDTVTEAATVSYSCPSGYSLSGTTCSITDSRPAVLSCGGITPKICENGTYTCPSGWALSGTTCHETVTQAATATYSCPSGYSLSGTTCSKTLTQTATANYSCPAGYSLSGSTCSVTLTASATLTYSCPSGYTLSGTTCSETLTVAASGSGAGVLVAESFAAFGNRRSGETWSGAPTSTDETSINGVSRWGYTGQTMLGVSLGLNHMNGRVEDAIVGRFLSPDPHIPDPSNAQSYNRYSYVINNPLTLTDPSGFDEESMPTDGFDDSDSGGGGGGGGGGDFSATDPGQNGGSTSATDPGQSDNAPDQLPDVGCGIPPNAPCIQDPTPPLDIPAPILTPGPTLTSLLPPITIGGGSSAPKPKASPAQSQMPTPPIMPCPSGMAADVAYGLFQMGQNAVAIGKVGVAAGTGLAIIAAPTGVGEVPAAALVAGGGVTTLTGYVMQLGGAGFLASQGDFGPLDSVLASALNLNVGFASPFTSISPTNPFSSAFSSAAGAISCRH